MTGSDSFFDSVWVGFTGVDSVGLTGAAIGFTGILKGTLFSIWTNGTYLSLSILTPGISMLSLCLICAIIFWDSLAFITTGLDSLDSFIGVWAALTGVDSFFTSVFLVSFLTSGLVSVVGLVLAWTATTGVDSFFSSVFLVSFLTSGLVSVAGLTWV